jgi:hypothetical protein
MPAVMSRFSEGKSFTIRVFTAERAVQHATAIQRACNTTAILINLRTLSQATVNPLTVNLVKPLAIANTVTRTEPINAATKVSTLNNNISNRLNLNNTSNNTVSLNRMLSSTSNLMDSSSSSSSDLKLATLNRNLAILKLAINNSLINMEFNRSSNFSNLRTLQPRQFRASQ